MQVNANPPGEIDATQTPIAQAVIAWRRAIGDSKVIAATSQYNIDASSIARPVAL